MRLRLFLNTETQKEDSPEHQKKEIGKNALRLAVVLLALLTLWVLVGSVAYPLWWFELFFKRGFLRWDLTEYGFTYLFDNVSWLLFGLPVFAVVLSVLAWKAWAKLSSFLDRFGAYVVACCLIACSIDGFVLNKTQRLQYNIYDGLLHVGDALAQASEVLVALGLPPSQIVPPLDFVYVDGTRVASLYEQLQPTFRENERTVTTERKLEGDLDLERKPLELKAGGSNSSTEARHFKNVDPSTATQCLDVINALLARDSPPYYATYGQLSSFTLRKQAKGLVSTVHKDLARPSLFVHKGVDPAAVATLKQLTELQKKTPPKVVENGIRYQLQRLSGLVIVQGEFDRTGLHADVGEFQEQFKGNPRPIYFRFRIADREALRLLTNRQKLLVLGDVIEQWDGGHSLQLHPIAILVSNP